jgi:hypothetical protein
LRKLTFNFYDGRNPDASKIHKIILARSDPYTHVELVDVTGQSFSSELGIGPRFKNITYKHPERWHKIVLHISNAEYDRIWYRADVLIALRKAGKLKYDNRGILGALCSGRHTIWAYFCSEAVYSVVSPEIALPELNYKLWPQKLYEVIEVIATMRKALEQPFQES